MPEAINVALGYRHQNLRVDLEGDMRLVEH